MPLGAPGNDTYISRFFFKNWCEEREKKRNGTRTQMDVEILVRAETSTPGTKVNFPHGCRKQGRLGLARNYDDKDMIPR